MPESDLSFEDFINDVDPAYREFARKTHEFMLQNGCKLKLMLAKNGYVVSYPHGKSKRVIMNFVFRKKCLVARIYGDFIGQYAEILETLPEKMKSTIEKAPVCKRFEDPSQCNSKCGGYVFALKDTQFQKCRYSCFMFRVDNETAPFIQTFLENELRIRSAE